ncbi:MAG: flagellar biosynthetic protein FliQ, partial [Pirellulaceae bacterium]
MNEEAVLELGQQAMITAITIAAPVLIVGAAVGLLVGIFQALTQIQDHTLSFVPKILAMLLVLTICLPWFID